jgi:hypothetical protein
MNQLVDDQISVVVRQGRDGRCVDSFWHGLNLSRLTWRIRQVSYATISIEEGHTITCGMEDSCLKLYFDHCFKITYLRVLHLVKHTWTFIRWPTIK